MITQTVQPLTPAAGCNCAVCPFYRGNPDAPQPVCSGCSSDCEYCACSRAADQRAGGPGGGCSRCPVRCGSRSDINAWMADVGPLTFDDLHVPGTPPVGLPNLIPQVDSTAISALDAALGWPGYALGLRRILSPETRKIYARWQGADARTMLGLSADQQAILVGHADDDMVETLWTRRRADHLAETIADQGWDLVIGPDFSVYGNQPRAEHLIAMRRSLLVAAELAAAGAPVAPTLHWFRHEDLQRYLDWIVDRHPAGPAAVACNLQTLRTDRAWNELALPGLALIAATLPPDLPVMLCGTSRASRIAELVTLFGTRTHVITQSPLHYARHGAVMTATGRQHTDWQVPELFAANVLYYHNLLEAHR